MAERFKSVLLVAAAAVAVCSFCVTLGQQQSQQGPVSELCLGCICEATSNCNRSLGCNGDVCGLFRITWPYWSDAGKPVIPQDHPDNEGAYVRCVTEPYCAATTVQGYMAKFGKDCNGDGIVNCFDYAAIHRLGGYGCSGALDYNYQNKFMNCQRQVQQLSEGK
ncbi:lysozyme-like [Zootermopsis nevadensis]|uniref:lysozyme-like n=1 Tax=Zootermopsis nevadensis TaxID=136037 RepID=UPI000B8E77A7|nr:lysozyme-like [Zootermopsis nevadensis]